MPLTPKKVKKHETAGLKIALFPHFVYTFLQSHSHVPVYERRQATVLRFFYVSRIRKKCEWKGDRKRILKRYFYVKYRQQSRRRQLSSLQTAVAKRTGFMTRHCILFSNSFKTLNLVNFNIKILWVSPPCFFLNRYRCLMFSSLYSLSDDNDIEMHDYKLNAWIFMTFSTSKQMTREHK